MSGEPLRGPWGESRAVGETGIELVPIPAARLALEPPRRNWMVEQCFLQGTVAMLSGDGGIGKSLLLQQLATCAVIGRAWLGLVVQPGRCLFFGCEDDQDELHRRQWRINRALGLEMDDVSEAGLELMPRVGQDNALVKFDRAAWRILSTNLFGKLAARCRRQGIQYLFLDTATHVFRGNQNDETQVVDFITELRRLAIAIQGVIVITKHPSLAGRSLGTGESGNVAWNNSVRSRLYLRKDKAKGLVLDTMKSNYGPKRDPLMLTYDHGVFVKSEAGLYS